MRSLEIHDAGREEAHETFARDLAAAASAAARGVATLRFWSRSRPAVELGRFHRMPENRRPERRLTGGRVLRLEPGVLCGSLVVPGDPQRPATSWLEPSALLRPDQILNRALRPMLGLLRALGADVFYPGRDLVTLNRNPVGCAAFSREPDGVLLVHLRLAVTSDFRGLADCLQAHDPQGVVGTDLLAMEESVALARFDPVESSEAHQPHHAHHPFEPSQGWARAIAPHVEREFRCRVDLVRGAPDWWDDLRVADADAYRAHLDVNVAPPAGYSLVSEPSMLGLVEAAADVSTGVIRDLSLTGDVIAPPRTIDELVRSCEGLAPEYEALDRVVTRVLSRPGSFILGVRDPAGLLARLG